MQQAKAKIIALWLHIWLKRIAKYYPEFFIQIIDDVVDNDKGKLIMHARYIDNLKFKQIPDVVHLELRQVYKIHQKIIDELVNL